MTRKKRSSSGGTINLQIKEPILAELEIIGPVYSKKNSSNFAWKKGKAIYLGNPAYNRAKPGYIKQLQTFHNPKKPIHGPITVWIIVNVRHERWFKEWTKKITPKKYSGTDVDNKLHSINDLLKAARIIHDDCQIVAIHAIKHYGKHNDDYGARIVISRYLGDSWL
ncbi:MAG: RusA family crossover junction endodeoxyribonuclease [Methanobacteriota archaeon]|nr:MAG: RusA family crossover junction endodeoxyribonuclease [Euryarchaeota archaeon]